MSQCLRVDDTVFENFLHSCSTETSAIQRVASVSFVTETPLSALCGSRKRKNIQVLSNNCGVCSEKHLSCRKKGTNKTHELHTSSFK